LKGRTAVYFKRLLLLIVPLLLAFALPAVAQKRVALVIGNAAYKETAPLINPRNDAADVTTALKRLGFEVIEGIDLDKRDMERIIRRFDVALAGAEVALFYYAGHGVQVAGQNHLVPVDAKLAAEGDLDFETLPLTLVLSRMTREAKTTVALLDACRDNPLARNLARSMGARTTAVGQGLAKVETGVGTLISFSTQPGNVALDGAGRNSPYTTALLGQLEQPGRDLMSVLAAVRGDVVKATGGRQVPWEHTSLLGPLVLKPADQNVAVTPASVPPSSSPPAQFPSPPAKPSEPVRPQRSTASEAAEAWAAVKDANQTAPLEAFIRRYGDTFYGDLAKARLTQLKTPKQLAVVPPPLPQPAASAPPQPKAEPPRSTSRGCVVDDPTGSPLNVRRTPQGDIVSTLNNGQSVQIQRLDQDYKGQDWALVSRTGGSTTLGWVIRKFVKCS
jgi:hypothetical protein